MRFEFCFSFFVLFLLLPNNNNNNNKPTKNKNTKKRIRTSYRKGMRLIFLSQDKDIFFTYGDVNELRDAGVSPGKSSLFFLTVASPPRRGDAHGIGSTGDMGERLVKCSIFRSIRCAHIGPWKSKGRELFSCLVVLITAAGFQGLQPLVNRTT